MGHSSSMEKLSQLQNNYTVDGPRAHPFFGSHHLLAKRTNPKQLLIRKEFIFRSGQQFQYVCRQYHKIQRKPFNLLYPTIMIQAASREHCSTVQGLYLYFQIVGKPLVHIIKTDGPISQAKAWFLLNQLSKSLQILEENGRAHWAISPQTVYRNKNQNYLLYDSFFVLGPDPTNFLNGLKDSREPLTQKTQAALERGAALAQSQGHQQDIYALGLTLFFAVTGVHARTLPPFPKKYESINKLLIERRAFIGEEIIRLIKQMTDREVSRRIDNKQLRKLLKQRQTDIIKKETIQYRSTHRPSLYGSYKINEKSPVQRGKFQETKRHGFNSPQRSFRQNELCTHDSSSKMGLRITPKSNNAPISPQDKSQNRDSTWQTKRSAVLPYSRHDIVMQKDFNLTRILSFDKLMNKR